MRWNDTLYVKKNVNTTVAFKMSRGVTLTALFVPRQICALGPIVFIHLQNWGPVRSPANCPLL